VKSGSDRRVVRKGVALAVLSLLLGGSGLGLAVHYGLGANSQPVEAVRAAVSVTGSSTQPILVVKGHHLSIPSRLPAGSPSSRPLCRLPIKGDAGFDYGDRFYVTVFARANVKQRLFGAGRFHPQFNELDCIGLIVLSHTSTHVTFTFGAAYTQFSYPLLEKGRLIKVVLDGRTYRQVVSF
jgi:hypothetical protein